MRGWIPLLLTLACLSGGQALAQIPRDFVPARGVAMGGGRMAASGNEAIFLNPAALAARRAYTLQLDYTGSSGASAAKSDGSALVLSIVDSVSNPNFPTGIAYRYMAIGEGASETRGSTKDVSVAFPIGDSLYLGTHLTYLSYTAGKREFSQFTGDLGLLMAFGDFKVGAVAYNIINVDSPDAARGIATGVAFSDEYTYRLSGDVRWDFLATTMTSWTLGAEYILGEAVPLRLGYDWDRVRSTELVSIGSGFQTREFGVDVSYRLDRMADTGFWSFALRLNGI